MRADRPEEVAALESSGGKKSVHQVSADMEVTLAKPEGAGKPIFCRILEKLLNERAMIRQKMKTETDPGVLAVLDNIQKSKKVACNSAYGLLGARKGYLSLPELAATTTFEGRQALEFSKGVAEKVRWNSCGRHSIDSSFSHTSTSLVSCTGIWSEDRGGGHGQYHVPAPA